MPKLLKRILIAVLILALLPVGYLLTGPYLDRRAVREANEFCSSVLEGDTFSALNAKAEKSAVALEKWPPRSGGEERYIARFPGFLANAVHCEISIGQKRVQAKFVEKEFW
jgi:hypothetical protein